MNYTTINQSNKLVEAGLDPKTADMHYDAIEIIVDKLPQKHVKVYPFANKYKEVKYECPCWSLGELIELMPKEINGERLTIELTNWSDWKYEVGYGLDTFQNDTLFDSILECMIWLLENNYIKKGETK